MLFGLIEESVAGGIGVFDGYASGYQVFDVEFALGDQTHKQSKVCLGCPTDKDRRIILPVLIVLIVIAWACAR